MQCIEKHRRSREGKRSFVCFKKRRKGTRTRRTRRSPSSCFFHTGQAASALQQWCCTAALTVSSDCGTATGSGMSSSSSAHCGAGVAGEFLRVQLLGRPSSSTGGPVGVVSFFPRKFPPRSNFPFSSFYIALQSSSAPPLTLLHFLPSPPL